MTKRILVDAVHPEEIRVAVADDSRLVEFDFESQEKKQIKSNIYLGKITRVEPSLQAAFVEYGGNRQGFLPFSEIHFDYYQIPTEDKEKLQKTVQAERNKEEQRIQEMEAAETRREAAQNAQIQDAQIIEQTPAPVAEPVAAVEQVVEAAPVREARPERPARREFVIPAPFTDRDRNDLIRAEELARYFTLEYMGEEYYNEKYGNMPLPEAREPRGDRNDRGGRPRRERGGRDRGERRDRNDRGDRSERTERTEIADNSDRNESRYEARNDRAEIQVEMPQIEDMEEERPMEDRALSRMEFYKQYKIQEVIKRNQIVLIQIVKEERGSKGASLTTYLALAGRYCVFMPNTDKGGGVSRRISNFTERKRIRDVIKQLDTPMGTSVIIRTAGMEREVEDIRKDYNYLINVWDTIRKQTLSSSAPALIYEESDIVKRSLRDMLKGDVSEVYIEGAETYKSARMFMEVIGSNQLDILKQYTGNIPVFQKFKIEEKLDELYEPEVKLSSGGSIVITPTEALVSIDVNSGKATKERSVEDTALKTNLEAAREIARQLKLRDLAGLIVIDFIDMREVRNRKSIERELKDALKADKAKIQIGRISAFGLLEMSRQRLRSSIVESSSGRCPMCRGIGVVRTTESLTLKAIRAIEAEAGRKSVKEIYLNVSHAIAHNIKEHRMKEIAIIEKNDDVKIIIQPDPEMLPNQFEISTQKFSSHKNKNRDHKKVDHSAPAEEKRPQQVAEAASIPAAVNPDEAKIDADVDEQLAAWQSEVADVEKIEARRYKRVDQSEDSTEGAESTEGNSNNNRNRNHRGDRNNNNRNDRRPGGGRNGGGRNDKRAGGQGGSGGGRNNPRRRNGGGGRRFDRFEGNYNGDSFGNEQEGNNVFSQTYGNDPTEKSSVERVERIDTKPERTENKPQAANQEKPSSHNPSKLVGLWKKITS